jgi:hypothetical protein
MHHAPRVPAIAAALLISAALVVLLHGSTGDDAGAPEHTPVATPSSVPPVSCPTIAGGRTTAQVANCVATLPPEFALDGKKRKRIEAVLADGNAIVGREYSALAGLGPRWVDSDRYSGAGAVSRMLRAGRFVEQRPLGGAELTRFGVPGPGESITVRARANSTSYMTVAGICLRLDTDYWPKRRWVWDDVCPTRGFVLRHPDGF